MSRSNNPHKWGAKKKFPTLQVIGRIWNREEEKERLCMGVRELVMEMTEEIAKNQKLVVTIAEAQEEWLSRWKINDERRNSTKKRMIYRMKSKKLKRIQQLIETTPEHMAYIDKITIEKIREILREAEEPLSNDDAAKFVAMWTRNCI